MAHICGSHYVSTECTTIKWRGHNDKRQSNDSQGLGISVE